jgi:hypothetical protein
MPSKGPEQGNYQATSWSWRAKMVARQVALQPAASASKQSLKVDICRIAQSQLFHPLTT